MRDRLPNVLVGLGFEGALVPGFALREKPLIAIFGAGGGWSFEGDIFVFGVCRGISRVCVSRPNFALRVLFLRRRRIVGGGKC